MRYNWNTDRRCKEELSVYGTCKDRITCVMRVLSGGDKGKDRKTGVMRVLSGGDKGKDRETGAMRVLSGDNNLESI